MKMVKKLSGWQLINVNTDDKKTTKLWTYLNQSGEVQTGWVNDNGTWYYLKELEGESKGIAFMQKGFIKLNKTWYYFDESGAMKENQWFQQEEGWYYADKSGALKVDEWFQVGNNGMLHLEKVQFLRMYLLHIKMKFIISMHLERCQKTNGLKQRGIGSMLVNQELF